ncbi:MAG: hypothetical protein JXA89_26430 [Anaerolineae bacterium]|nr:hypothetical protein [Anaerolineae bacterium]
MPYRFATERQQYTDYASGKVFYSPAGTPAFPVRLASEMLQRCTTILRADSTAGPWAIYDPCCGSAYLLSTLAFLHWDDIRELVGSDIDAHALSLAQANLALLTVEGMTRRIARIEEMLAAYGKQSHQDALQSAGRLQARLLKHLELHAIQTALFVGDVTDTQALEKGLQGKQIDVIISDVPYGQHSTWQVAEQITSNPAWHMLDALRSVIPLHTVLAIASDKAQKIAHQGYRRIERFRLGKRQVTILRPNS